MNIHPKPIKEYNPKKNLGYLHIYTGEGKGKTTAALGALLRAAGQGHKVLMIQFLKGHKDAGEVLAVQQMGDHVELIQFGRDDLLSLDDLQTIDAYFANQAINYARDAMRRNRPDILILDEIMAAINSELIELADVVDFLDNRHQETEVILTGAQAHPVLLNMADLITVMDPIKDYYDRESFQPRLGIEH